MKSVNELLTQVEAKSLWAYFHKDWLLQIRGALRLQLPVEYYVFVESEVILLAPEAESPPASTLPDISVARDQPETSNDREPLHTGTLATIEVEEPCEVFTKYVVLIRRAPENHVVAAIELLSPSNKGISSLIDKERYLRKRAGYFEAGINLLEIDALVNGEAVTPPSLNDLNTFERRAWTTFHTPGQRRWRGWGWNAEDAPPTIPWSVEEGISVLVDLNLTAAEAQQFNQWDQLVR